MKVSSSLKQLFFCPYMHTHTHTHTPTTLPLASIPGRREGEKAAWYTLHAHARTLPQKGVIHVFVSKINTYTISLSIINIVQI